MIGEVRNVVEIYIMATGILLLAILLIVLPFRLTWRGKTLVLLTGIALSLLTFISIPMFSYWVIFPTILLLAGLVSFLLIKNVEIFRVAPSHNKKQADHNTEPLFSYAQLKEKAMMADTIDDYYIDSTKLVSADREEMVTTNDIGKEAPYYAIGQDEIDKFIKKQLEETAVAMEKANDQEMEREEPDWTSADPSIALDYVEMDQLEEVTLTVRGEENHVLPSQLEEIDFSPNDHSNEVVVLTDRFESDAFEQFEQERVEEDISLLKEDFDDGSSVAPQVPEVSFDEIDYKQRALASSIGIIDDSNEELNLSISEDEVDLSQIRKRLFEQLDEVKTVESLLDQTEEEPVKVEKNPFSSQELESAFDDLEELYLKRKSNEKNEEEHK